MRRTAQCVLVSAACLATFTGISAYAKKKSADDTRQFFQEIPKDQRISQALSRLTFGARPGEAAQVKAMGLKKWIELQLHPDQIPENPTLEAKLKYLDTLAMSSEELVRNYPTPQMVKQMVAGQVPFPTDPDRRVLIEKLVAKYENKQAAGGDAAPPPGAPEAAALRTILTPEQLRALRQGTPQQRVAFFQSLPAEKQDDVIGAMPAQLRQAMYAAATPEMRRKLILANGPQQVVARDLMEAKMLRAVYSTRQLNEQLVDFWFNHFNIYLEKGADRYLVTEYERDAIRPHVLGKFRDLLEATAKSPAMLFYLDNWQSVGPDAPQPRGVKKEQRRRGLNENYGRELLELHTLGVDGGYTQKDVTEVARCFTGWTINQPQRGGKFTFAPRQHDRGEKVVLGVTIPAGGGIQDGEKVLDILSHSPATARFISRNLAQHFVADEPPASLVNAMAQTFLKSDGDIRQVLETMLNSKEFWSVAAYRSKMKSPLEMVASAVRAVNGDVDFAFALTNQVAQLGEPLYRKQEPTGYSNSSREWLNSAGLVARMNFALQLADNKVPGVKVEVAQAAKPDDAQAFALGSPEFQKR
ncbi:MAG TPA: DUF1800 domain-containing protein [Candidatus Sulfopaludibacter sp.]|jgi:uncharacterized protein (DUF1800 family)|nr:DUF1800 domain-containing protein [Candidatus Sulfopaludibacter sp.]